MGQAPTFIELLEAMLAPGQSTGPTGPDAIRSPFPPSPYLFLSPPPGPFLAPSNGFHAATRARYGNPSPAGGRQQPPVPPRPKRTLSTRERRALDELVRLGARLGADFTGDELRSAFRSLARRYHPDRHPHTSRGEKARLAEMFARAREAYQALRSTAAASVS